MLGQRPEEKAPRSSPALRWPLQSAETATAAGRHGSAPTPASRLAGLRLVAAFPWTSAAHRGSCAPLVVSKKSTVPAKNVTGCSKKKASPFKHPSKNTSHLQQKNTSAGCIKNCCRSQQKMLPVAAKGIEFAHPSKKTLDLIPTKFVAGASKK